MSNRPGSGAGSAAAAIPMAFLLFLPMLALAIHGVRGVPAAITDPDARSAIGVSLRTTTLSLAAIVLLGTPLAVTLARWRFPGRSFLAVLVEAPLVLPPAAAGIGLLLALGKEGIVPTGLPFTAGAVVVAQTFVAAPLYVRSLSAAIEAVDPDLESAAAIDGGSAWAILRLITFPAVRSSMFSGAILAWARSLGEFGATILFAGNMAGVTQTMPLSIYLGLESGLDQATGLSVLLLLAAVVVLILVRLLERRR